VLNSWFEIFLVSGSGISVNVFKAVATASARPGPGVTRSFPIQSIHRPLSVCPVVVDVDGLLRVSDQIGAQPLQVAGSRARPSLFFAGATSMHTFDRRGGTRISVSGDVDLLSSVM